jgi:hypothetical protein
MERHRERFGLYIYRGESMLVKSRYIGMEMEGYNPPLPKNELENIPLDSWYSTSDDEITDLQLERQ